MNYVLGDRVHYDLADYKVSTVQYWINSDATGEDREVATITRRALEQLFEALGRTP